MDLLIPSVVKTLLLENAFLRFDIFTPSAFLCGFLSASLKSFLEIERDFSHLRDALFLVTGLESASLVLDGRREDHQVKMPKHGVCICAKGTDLPCKAGEEALHQDSLAVRSGEVRMLATPASSQGLSNAFLCSGCCLRSA